MGMQLITCEGGGHIVARLAGELDAVNAADGAAAITAATAPGQCLIVDMAALEFIDCCALSTLLAVRELARHEGGDLLLAAPAGSVLRLLALTGWDGEFSVHASVAAAAASITGGTTRELSRASVTRHNLLQSGGRAAVRIWLGLRVAGWCLPAAGVCVEGGGAAMAVAGTRHRRCGRFNDPWRYSSIHMLFP